MRCLGRNVFLALGVAVCAAHAAAGASLSGESEVLEPDAAGRFRLKAEVAAGSYARLWRSQILGGPARVVAMARAAAEGAPVALADPLPLARQGFYRVEAVPLAAPLDADGDGVNDLDEMAGVPALNPLNSAPGLPMEDGAVYLRDRAAYDVLSHRDNFPGAFGVQEVKFLISEANTASPKLYFFNTNKRVYHYDFAREVLGFGSEWDYWFGLTEFNNITYFTNAHRRFIAGSLVLYPNYTRPGHEEGLFAVEFWPSDPVAEPFVRTAVELAGAALPFVSNGLAYHPSGETQRALLSLEKESYATSPVPVISTEELFSQVRYTLLNPGVAFGRLRLVWGAEVLSARDIPIYRTLPNDLTRVAAIISSTPQTPLSHINLKAKQNGSPNCYVRDAETDPQILPLLDKYVRLEAAPDGLILREATQQEVDAYFETIRPITPQTPPRDLSRTAITPTGSMAFADSKAFGPKAANLAEMARWLPAGVVPSGHAVPFYFYDEFMRANGLYDTARQMVADERFQNDPARRDKVLKDFRQLIRAAPAPAWMYEALNAVTAAYPAGQSLRCRSSTNNEDLPGFNGAGLYDSYTHRPGEGHLINSVRQVWASLWNYRAFEERDFNRIDHFAASMGVLIYPNFDDEKANGVGVSRNIFDPNWRGSYVNVQLGEALVTNPVPGAVPEELLIADLMGEDRYEIQYVRFSSLMPEGEKILSRAQAYQLADMLATIESRFRSLYGRYGDTDFAMEIEFKIDPQDRLIIKQARPWVE